ncbi:hypothetical protein NE237_019713 [Protea cynaroides]|uniref:Uncharacterized protein n=1 Tax=Protea cynaroides TaxID=273540 RepID=A0A9Q0H594_9MAGN|nr:hypothetical protein NE237_019713 [Protea cynaroides]
METMIENFFDSVGAFSELIEVKRRSGHSGGFGLAITVKEEDAVPPPLPVKSGLYKELLGALISGLVFQLATTSEFYGDHSRCPCIDTMQCGTKLDQNLQPLTKNLPQNACMILKNIIYTASWLLELNLDGISVQDG